ncbi:MAG: lamin tail domain-containing protein, partial [Candidatus Cloacimonetes bacterium]|nr:lamin tail domain-containing protein [Candidatus Cloacimonadota bacterium]
DGYMWIIVDNGIVPGHDFRINTRVFNNGDPAIRYWDVRWYDSSDTQVGSDYDHSGYAPTNGVWEDYTTPDLTAPAGAAKLRIHYRIYTYSSTSTNSTLVDNVTLTDLDAGSPTVTIAPIAPQVIEENTDGILLTVTEMLNGDTFVSRDWGYRTVSGGAITSLGLSGLDYIPNFATASTYFVVCSTVFTIADTLISNEVEITVTAAGAVAPATGEVFISEVCDNDIGGYMTGYMEIANVTDHALDMQGVWIERWDDGVYNNYTYTFNAGVTIPANGFLIVARGSSQADFETAWGVDLSALNTNYEQGSTNLYFTTGRGYVLADGRAILDNSPDVEANQRAFQSSPGSWVNGEDSSLGTPGELDTGQTLPVEFSAFTAVLANKFVNLMWVTQSETGVSGYNVLRNDVNDYTSTITVTPQLIPATNTSTEQTYSFADNIEIEEGTYYYWIQTIELNSNVLYHGPVTVTIIENEAPKVCHLNHLNQNMPNPFNPDTSIGYQLKGEAGQKINASLIIYNIKGQVVKTLFDGPQEPTDNGTVSWSGMNEEGNKVSSGVYFYQLKTDSFISMKKMLLMK